MVAWEGKKIKEGDCVSTLMPPTEDDRRPPEATRPK